MGLATTWASSSPLIRLASFRRHEWCFLIGGVSAALLSLVWVASPEDAAPGDELASTQPPLALPQTMAQPPVQPTEAVASPTSVRDLVLHGVFGGGPRGGGAVIAFGSGQRVVPLGREFLPGLILKDVGLAHAVITSSAGETRLELGGRAEAQSMSAPPAAATPHDQRVGRETIDYRLGLEPRRENGRIAGFAIRPGAELPVLQRAGLKPGDVLVAVNGQAFKSEEKVLELSREIAGSYTAEFEFVRNGRRMNAALEVNKRP